MKSPGVETKRCRSTLDYIRIVMSNETVQVKSIFEVNIGIYLILLLSEQNERML